MDFPGGLDRIPVMKQHSLPVVVFLAAFSIFNQTAIAQLSTPPATEAEKEATYELGVTRRTEAIVKLLNLTDEAKSNKAQEIILAQYHALRTRDEAIDGKLKAAHKELTFANRADDLAVESKPLHEKFLGQLTEILTSEQVEQIKDAMTYNTVKVTYNAYCAIIPGLTDADKAKILEQLKLAREEAIDGGNAPEKHAIFQKYKDQINDYLNNHGYDVAKAYKEWDAKQAAAAKTATDAVTKTAEPPK